MAKRKALAVNAAGEQPKPQDNAPAVMTEREKRAARLPRFTGNRLDTTKEQLEGLKDELHTDHGELLRSTVATAISGNLAVQGEATEADVAMNAALQLLVELRPQNSLERLVVAQLIACDKAATQCLNIGFNKTNEPESRRRYLGLSVQFQNVLVRQVEALNKLRTGGNQVVRVEHVHVAAGGQAFVGNVAQTPVGGGGAIGRD